MPEVWAVRIIVSFIFLDGPPNPGGLFLSISPNSITESTPNLDEWTTVQPDDAEFHDHNGENIPLY